MLSNSVASAFVGPVPASHAPAAQFVVDNARTSTAGLLLGASAAPTTLIGASVAALGAVALAGSRRQAGGTTGATIVQAFENELGVQAPVGFWDPAGFTSDGSVYEFTRRRCVEIKHGRVSMLACIGYIVPEYFKWPGYISPSSGIKFADVPNGLAALSKVPALGWAQIVGFGLQLELFGAWQQPNDPPGQLTPRFMLAFTEVEEKQWFNSFYFGPYGIPNAPRIADPEIKKKKLSAELANGRLAMVAIMGMMFQNGTVGTTGPEMWFGSSAFESELGVQAPVGFWDPVGFTADGDVAAFKRRRSVELKHGRISMLACMGFMTPEVTGKLPGYLSPSTNLKFADIPNGIGAISKVPALGWAQIIAYMGFCEVSGGFNDYKTGTPGDYGFKVLTSKDPAELTNKLNSEIANSRLAMTAIMAMIFQNGTVGSTGPEMWLGARASATPQSPVALKALPKALEGTGGPFPDQVWDPLNLMEGKTEEQILYWRAVELKHSRVAMLACLGWFHVAAGWHFIGDAANGYVRVSDDPLINVTQLPMGGAWQLVFTIMCLEWLTSVPCPPPKEAPWDVLGWTPIVVETEAWKETQLRELNNGRLAMFGILGLIAQDAYTGNYFAGIGKPCFGGCDPGAWNLDFAIPLPQPLPFS